MAKLFANSEDPDQMPHSAASDLRLHGQLPFYRSPDYNGSKPIGESKNCWMSGKQCRHRSDTTFCN